MEWIIEYTKNTEKDLDNLDNSQRIQVIKSITKVAVNPLPNNEGGYGKPLRRPLSGCMKIKLLGLGLRVVYKLEHINSIMKIIVISVRDDETVYKMAEQRLKK